VPYVMCVRALGIRQASSQNRLLPIERWNLAFLVNAKDKRPVGGREVKPTIIAHLVRRTADRSTA